MPCIFVGRTARRRGSAAYLYDSNGFTSADNNPKGEALKIAPSTVKIASRATLPRNSFRAGF
jgi:hypothetical protein